MSTGQFDPARIRAVAFDGYGTVLDFHYAEFRSALGQLLAEHQIERDHDEFYRAWAGAFSQASPWARAADADGRLTPRGQPGADEAERRERMLNGPLPPWISQREIWRGQFEVVFGEYEVPAEPSEAAEWIRDLLTDATPYDDARDTLDRLDAGGLRLGLLSNADDDFLAAAVARGRLRFSAVESSESLRAYKPHRVVFEAICGRLDCEPESVLYVGDSPHADVRGAHNAGLRTAWLRRANEVDYPEGVPAPDLTITSLRELADELLAATTAGGGTQ